MAAVSGVYTLVRPATATSTAITIQQVTAPAGTAVEFVRCWVTQSTIVTSAQAGIRFLRKSTPATVTSATPALLGVGMQASKCVGGTGATGITASNEQTDGAVYVEEGFNVVNGWLYLPVPEERVYLVNATAGLKFTAAPSATSYQSGQTWLEYASA